MKIDAPKIALGVGAVAFNILLAKGKLEFLPDWVPLAAMLLAAIVWLIAEPLVREVVASALRTEGGKILHPTTHEPIRKPQIKAAVIRIVIVLAIAIILGGSTWAYRRSEAIARRPRPAPVTGLKVGFASASAAVTMPKRALIKVTPSEQLCSEAGIGYGADGLEKLPGGPGLSRPQLLIVAHSFFYRTWSDHFYDLFFEVVATDRGEATIAKDWRLCLVQGKEPKYYDSQPVDNADLYGEVDLANSTYKASIEHGHAVKGWLRFHVPEADVNPAKFYGTVECKDYLEHKSRFLFRAN